MLVEYTQDLPSKALLSLPVKQKPPRFLKDGMLMSQVSSVP